MTWNGHEKTGTDVDDSLGLGLITDELVVVDDDLAHEEDVDVDISKSWDSRRLN